jgi:hypothetical protein
MPRAQDAQERRVIGDYVQDVLYAAGAGRAGAAGDW